MSPDLAFAQVTMPWLSLAQYMCPSCTRGDGTLELVVPVQTRCVSDTSPRPPSRTANAAPERPPIQYETPSATTVLGTMYHGIRVSHAQSCLPVFGSRPSTFP